jgi:hypothetical protein
VCLVCHSTLVLWVVTLSWFQQKVRPSGLPRTQNAVLVSLSTHNLASIHRSCSLPASVLELRCKCASMTEAQHRQMACSLYYHPISESKRWSCPTRGCVHGDHSGLDPNCRDYDCIYSVTYSVRQSPISGCSRRGLVELGCLQALLIPTRLLMKPEPGVKPRRSVQSFVVKPKRQD